MEQKLTVEEVLEQIEKTLEVYEKHGGQIAKYVQMPGRNGFDRWQEEAYLGHPWHLFRTDIFPKSGLAYLWGKLKKGLPMAFSEDETLLIRETKSTVGPVLEAYALTPERVQEPGFRPGAIMWEELLPLFETDREAYEKALFQQLGYAMTPSIM